MRTLRILGALLAVGLFAGSALAQHISTSSPATPSSGGAATIASGACGTGSNGTITGNNNYGKITIGASATTTCTVTYATALPAAQISCLISAGNATAIGATVLPYVSSITTAGFVITGAVMASTIFYYHCY